MSASSSLAALLCNARQPTNIGLPYTKKFLRQSLENSALAHMSQACYPCSWPNGCSSDRRVISCSSCTESESLLALRKWGRFLRGVFARVFTPRWFRVAVANNLHKPFFTLPPFLRAAADANHNANLAPLSLYRRALEGPLGLQFFFECFCFDCLRGPPQFTATSAVSIASNRAPPATAWSTMVCLTEGHYSKLHKLRQGCIDCCRSCDHQKRRNI